MARRLPIRIVALIILAGFCAAAVFAFRGLGRWLVREDSLAPADVIAVLSGAMPWRAEEAARIFRLGDGGEVWVTRPDSPEDALAQMGIHYLGEDYFNREVLVRGGVPESDVRVLPGTVVDTEQEIEEIGAEMSRDGRRSVIIVTSPQHTRRVKVLWHKLVGGNPHAIVRAAYEDPFDANHWWRDTRDTFAVIRELMGLLNAWLGLPVRPRFA